MSKHVLKLFFVSLIFLAASCAPKRIAVPSFEGRAFNDLLSEKSGISSIDAKVAILFEKNGSEIRGDAALDVAKTGDISLRVYSLGFLAMEITSRNGRVKSDPVLDRGKKAILTRGLRDCLFWWDIKDYLISDEGGYYILKNPEREIWIDKKTFLPDRQTIRFEDGRVLYVFYSEPANDGDSWYQSKIRIELSKYAVTLTIKKMAFKS
ncbi:MAG: hypothetical protein M0Z60_05225 [Nitrospiraceae bacterium]|nr:hypothetical protein [Nitrospiraceae bacterium]